MKTNAAKSITISNSVAETKKLAAAFSQKLKKLPALIILNGDLGAGKTQWAQGFIQKYIGAKTVVTSPTYSLMNAYKKGAKEVYHFDLYRLQSEDDLESTGFWDFLEKKHVLLVEWGEKLPRQWPNQVNVFEVTITSQSETKREILTQKIS